MSFTRSVLEPDEELLAHTHPHWRRLVRPALVALVGAGLAGIAGGFAEVQLGPEQRRLAWAVIAVVCLAAAARSCLLPALRWARTDLVVTDRRIVYRPAGSRRRLLDLPLTRVSAVRFRHTLGDRALGTGALVLECGHHPTVEIEDVPRVADVHALVYEQLSRLRVPLRLPEHGY